MFWFDVLRLQIANLTLICCEGLPLKCLGAIIKTITLIFRKFLSGSTFRGVYYRFRTCWLSFPLHIYTGFFSLLLFFYFNRPRHPFPPSFHPRAHSLIGVAPFLRWEGRPRELPLPRLRGARGGSAASAGPGARSRGEPGGARPERLAVLLF